MAKTIASLSVSINASTKGLRKGLRNANKIIGNFASSATRAIADVAKIGAGLATLGAGIAAAGTLKAMSSLDNLAKTARKLDIKPTMLVALRDAAKESGVEVKTFDMGLQRMLRRIQEASKGKGEALGALADLGLDPKRLARMAPEKQFEAVAKAMAATKDEGMRLARAMKLFDSEGVALVNTLEVINKKGLKGFIEQAQRSGRGGDLLEGRLGSVEEVVDQWTRITDHIGGLFQQMALSVSGPLEATFQHFEIFLHKHSGTIQKFFVDMMKWGMQATSAIHQFFSRGTGPIADFRDQLIEWAQIAIDKFNGVAEAIKNITARIQEATAMAKQFWADTKNFREGAAEIGGKGWRAAKGLDKSAQQLLGAKSMGDVQQAGDTFKNTMADLLRGFQTKLLRDVFSAPRSGVMREDPELKKQTKLLHDIATKNLQRSGATGQYVLVAG